MITEPIDMLTIEANIKNDKYTSEEEIIADFKVRILLMFKLPAYIDVVL